MLFSSGTVNFGVLKYIRTIEQVIHEHIRYIFVCNMKVMHIIYVVGNSGETKQSADRGTAQTRHEWDQQYSLNDSEKNKHYIGFDKNTDFFFSYSSETEKLSLTNSCNRTNKINLHNHKCCSSAETTCNTCCQKKKRSFKPCAKI